jgi:uncharacterized OsmC-like protein
MPQAIAAHVEGERPMGSMDDIRAACERTASTLSARPAIGQHTFVTRVRVHDGLTCDIEEGPWHLTADLPHQLGGHAAGPTPGMFGRAALGSCLAICYVMWAARLGVPLTSVAVEVHADTDTRGLLGIAEVPAGYTDIRYVVSLTSPAPPADIIRVLDTAEGHSPYMDVFKCPHALRRIVHIATPAEETP